MVVDSSFFYDGLTIEQQIERLEVEKETREVLERMLERVNRLERKLENARNGKKRIQTRIN